MGTRLYVGNLSYNTTEADLRVAFESDGRQVREVAIISDRETGRPKGFAFVQMGSEEDAQAAIAAWNGQTLDGRPLKVNEAQDRPARSGGFGGGGGGGPSRGGPRGGGGDRDSRGGGGRHRDY